MLGQPRCGVVAPANVLRGAEVGSRMPRAVTGRTTALSRSGASAVSVRLNARPLFRAVATCSLMPDARLHRGALPPVRSGKYRETCQ